MKLTIKGLVIGALSSASATGVGVVGWKCYDSAYPTVDNALGQQGYKLSEASVPAGNYTPAENKKFNWKQWDCSSRLFPGVEAKADSATGSGATSPSIANINISSDNAKNVGKAIGCLAMNMHPWTDKSQTPQSRFYLQMEAAVRNDKFGFILWTGILLGKFSSTAGSTTFDFEHRMFLLENEGGKWTIRGGYAWIDASLPTVFNVNDNFLVVKTPEGYWLDKEIINTWNRSNSWVGVWEETDAEGHHPLMDIVIGLGTNSDKSKYDMEIYGLDEAFAATNSSHPGYEQVSKYYDTTNSQWNSITPNLNKKDELKNWYSPFNNKKGKWTEMGKRCGFLSGSRTPLSEVGSIKNLCYQRTTDSSA